VSLDATTLDMAERLGRTLHRARLRLATAESCTGGGLAYAITAIPGSSEWFERGFVTYTNDAKQEMLSVPQDTLVKHGAVSEETAASMAIGALVHTPADVSVSITGIAGPDGGTKEKPVGTVCLGWARRGGQTRTARVVFEGDRARVREQSILMAMQGLLDMLGGDE
jgi:nicotinamide-nucleotide amidase